MRHGKEANPEKKQAKAVKNLRYVLLKNPKNLSENQQVQLEFLTQASPRLYCAYLLKEGLRLALKADAEGIVYSLNKWMDWAQRCCIPSFRELHLKIKRDFTVIVASAMQGFPTPA
ncbi:MAG: transposase [Clostridiales bacterium]|nr:transposase [Clostridiales bacterium]